MGFFIFFIFRKFHDSKHTFSAQKSQSRCNDAVVRSCPKLGASLALRVFHWPTVGAVRGAEGTAAALPWGGGSQLRARSGGSSSSSLHPSVTGVGTVFSRSGGPKLKKAPRLCEWVSSDSKPGLKSRGAGERSACAVGVWRSSQCFSPSSGKKKKKRKVLIPRTFTTKSSRSAKRGQNAMNATGDYFRLLLVLVAVMTDMGAKGKKCPKIFTLFFFSLFLILSLVNSVQKSLSALDLVSPTWDVFVMGLCLIFARAAFRFHGLLLSVRPCAHTAHWLSENTLFTEA